MAENNTNNVSMDESTEEAGITMVDILQEEEDLENDAAAVLGAGDDTHCSYSLVRIMTNHLYKNG